MAPLKNFDRVAEIYDCTRAFPPGAAATIARGLAAFLPPAAHVVEVGVGTGRVAVPLTTEGVRVTGFDISRGMLAVLHSRRSPVAALLAEASRQPFRDGAFDAGLFVHILHLVPDPEATIRETVRVVRPGGVLLAGATSSTTSPARTAGEAIRRITREVAGLAIPPFNSNDRYSLPPLDQQAVAADPPFRRLMRELGAPIEDHTLARWEVTTTAREQLHELERQVHSQTWSIPPDQLASIVEQATPEVIRVMGGLDSPVTHESIFRVSVARLPGTPRLY
jgi:ubiquinone/menaquinone biosynthesis C-methylase UbiE